MCGYRPRENQAGDHGPVQIHWLLLVSSLRPQSCTTRCSVWQASRACLGNVKLSAVQPHRPIKVPNYGTREILIQPSSRALTSPRRDQARGLSINISIGSSIMLHCCGCNQYARQYTMINCHPKRKSYPTQSSSCAPLTSVHHSPHHSSSLRLRPSRGHLRRPPSPPAPPGSPPPQSIVHELAHATDVDEPATSRRVVAITPIQSPHTAELNNEVMLHRDNIG